MRSGVHVITRDGTCAICGTAQSHLTWAEARLAEIAARPLTPWQTAMKARIDTARQAGEGRIQK